MTMMPERIVVKGRILTSSSSFNVALGTADVRPAAFLFVAAIVWEKIEINAHPIREQCLPVSLLYRQR